MQVILKLSTPKRIYGALNLLIGIIKHRRIDYVYRGIKNEARTPDSKSPETAKVL
jgi:hypothetical protein